MNRSMGVVILGLLALVTAGPTIVCLAQALIPLVLVVGTVVGLLRVIWYLTQNRW